MPCLVKRAFLFASYGQKKLLPSRIKLGPWVTYYRLEFPTKPLRNDRSLGLTPVQQDAGLCIAVAVLFYVFSDFLFYRNYMRWDVLH